jgi:hypothetical protein
VKLDQFVTETDLLNKVEIEKVRLLGYYYLRRDEISEFTVKDISNWFQTLNLPSPNKSRLRNRLQKSRQFIRGSSDALFCLHAKEIAELDVLYLEQFYSNEEVTSSDTILPAALYLKTRGYIETLGMVQVSLTK